MSCAEPVLSTGYIAGSEIYFTIVGEHGRKMKVKSGRNVVIAALA